MFKNKHNFLFDSLIDLILKTEKTSLIHKVVEKINLNMQILFYLLILTFIIKLPLFINNMRNLSVIYGKHLDLTKRTKESNESIISTQSQIDDMHQ